MLRLLYTGPDTGENKWEETSVESGDQAAEEIEALARKINVDPGGAITFFEDGGANA